MNRAVWCEYAWLGGDRPEPSVLVEIDGGRFRRVDPGAPAGDAERRPGLTLPGFANVHSHAFHRALRGRTHGVAGDFWSWRQSMYRLAGRLDPTAYFRLARATFSEMVLAGYTTVGEFHYLHHGPAGRPYADPNELGHTVIAAARDAGMRITLLDTCYLHGGIGRPLDPVQLRFGDGSVDAWIDRVDRLRLPDEGARLGAAVHSVRACTPAEIAVVAGHARSTGLRLHAHLSEQPGENEACEAAYGVTPTELMEEAGALGQDFTAVHATHLTASDRSRLGEHRVTACICPTTERDLGDGVGDIPALVDAGATLALGSDSNAVIDAFEEARCLELHERLRSLRRGRFDPVGQLEALTDHTALGWPDVGRIASGWRADLVTVDIGSVRLAGSTVETMLPTVVYAATASDVRTVTVDGVDRVTDSRYQAGDVAHEFAELLPRLFT
ncbi:MAG TPA: formimidoylglutamate deiminase [Acidimicrobiia bacterium]|nr:formimidoylglutamate deiminase [Acidimicrobiia bacterium]